MLIIASMSVLAGSLENYEFNTLGEERSDDNVTIDADTLNGLSETNITEPLWSYVSASSAGWSKDRVGGGYGRESIAKLLTGNKKLFSFYDTFLEYLNQFFVTREQYDKDITALTLRLDAYEAGQAGVSVDEYQKQLAIETGVYGAYECFEGLCVKSIN